MSHIRPVVAIILLSTAITWAADKKKKDDVSQIGNRDVGRGINIYSIDREIALGKQLAQEIQRQARMVDDPTISEYVNRLGQNLARNSDAKVPFTFQVIDAPELNAFAFPGGFIFVHTGLLQATETEAELAGAIAHEVAHVAARHMTRAATKRQLTSIATIPLSILFGGLPGYAVRQGANVAIPMTFLKFDRAYEAEADYLGLQYMYAAGYDPTASVDLFERMDSLQRRHPGAVSRLFSTHPMTSDRVRKTQDEIGKILSAKPEYVVTTSEFVAVRDRVIAAENRRRIRSKPEASVLKAVPEEEKSDERPTLKRRDLVE